MGVSNSPPPPHTRPIGGAPLASPPPGLADAAAAGLPGEPGGQGVLALLGGGHEPEAQPALLALLRYGGGGEEWNGGGELETPKLGTH